MSWVTLACRVASRSLLDDVVDVVELTLLLSCLVVAVPTALSVAIDEDVLVSKLNSVFACWAEGASAASEQTLRGLAGVFVEPVAFCVDRYESSLLISVMIFWSTPL